MAPLKTIFICPRCEAISTVKSKPDSPNFCPKCYQRLYNTKMSPEDWRDLPKEKQQTIINTAILDAKNAAEKKAKDAELAAEAERIAKEKRANEEAERIAIYQKQKNAFLTTTGFSFETHKIISYLGIKSGEVVLGTGFFSEFAASVTDLAGTESNVLATKLARAKDSALDKLIYRCIDSGANAVIGVDLDFSVLGNNMIVACANGTAVKVEPLDEI